MKKQTKKYCLKCGYVWKDLEYNDCNYCGAILSAQPANQNRDSDTKESSPRNNIALTNAWHPSNLMGDNSIDQDKNQ